MFTPTFTRTLFHPYFAPYPMDAAVEYYYRVVAPTIFIP
jgi:hypothetical protein